MTSPVAQLTLRDLNRATLARQHLLARTSRTALEVMHDLVGLQSQSPNPPFTGLWSRIEGFAFEELSRAMVDRTAARLLLMRGTVHLVTAADALGLRPVVQAPMQREYSAVRKRRLPGVDLDEADAICVARLRTGPQTPKQLGDALVGRWPDLPHADLASLPRLRLAVVQIPPRGVWGASGMPTYALAEDWLGAPLAAYSLDEVVRRYLAAFGPATVKDAQAWSGLTRLAPVFAGLEPELVVFEGPSGERLYDLPEAPRPPADTPAPVRILPEWDNLLLSHADRSRVISREYRAAMSTSNGMTPGAVLVDGQVVAFCKTVLEQGRGVHRVVPLQRLSKRVQREIEDEAQRLLAAMGPRYAGGQVRIEAVAERWVAA